MSMFKEEHETIECETCGKDIIVKTVTTFLYDKCPHCLEHSGNPYAEENMKLLNEKKQTGESNTKLRLWEIQTKVIYEDDYKTKRQYKKACDELDDSWIFITSDSGWNGHGGYSMYQKVVD